MTKEELRNIDLLVSEHVMGFVPVKKMIPVWSFTDLRNGGFTDVERDGYNNSVGDFIPAEEMPYYTDRSMSLSVLERCSEAAHGAIRMVRIQGHPSSPVSWEVSDDLYISGADTLELAICLFSLRLFKDDAEAMTLQSQAK